MANTFVKLASTTVGAGGTSLIEFSSIPQTYTDLKLLISARQAAASVNHEIYFYFNADNSSVYSVRTLVGSGSAASSGSFPNYGALFTAQAPAANATSNTFGTIEIYIPNYAGSTNKSLSIDEVCETNATAADMRFMAGLFAKTNAITSVAIATSSSLVQYSTATLYGISKS